MDYLKSSICNSLFLFPRTAGEIEISKLNSNNACGPLSIPTHILKLIKETVAKPLEIIFNISFTTGIVPSGLRIANVIPV